MSIQPVMEATMYFLPGQKSWFRKEKWKIHGKWMILMIVLLLCSFGAGTVYSLRRLVPEAFNRERARLVQEIEQEKTTAKALSEENADLYGVIGEAFGKNSKLMIEAWRAKHKPRAGG